MIKDNHVAAAGGIAAALGAVRSAGVRVPVQIEVDSLEQLSEALELGIDAVLLDNMRPDTVADAVRLIRAHPKGAPCWIEASGGITLTNVRRYAEPASTLFRSERSRIRRPRLTSRSIS